MPELKRRIRELESKDPLKDNNTLIRAVEIALQLMHNRRYRALIKPKKGLLRNPAYLRKFIRLALDPNVTRAEAAVELGVNLNTLEKHIQAFTGYLNEFVNDAHLLRSREVGFGWAKDHDLEEQ